MAEPGDPPTLSLSLNLSAMHTPVRMSPRDPRGSPTLSSSSSSCCSSDSSGQGTPTTMATPLGLPTQPRRTPFQPIGCLLYVCLYGAHDKDRFLRCTMGPQDLGRHFAQFGRVTDVMMKDYYALVVYSEYRGAAAALVHRPEDHVIANHRVRAAATQHRPLSTSPPTQHLAAHSAPRHPLSTAPRPVFLPQVVVRPYTPKMQTLLLAHLDAQMQQVRRMNAQIFRALPPPPAAALPPRPEARAKDDSHIEYDDRIQYDGLPVLPDSLY